MDAVYGLASVILYFHLLSDWPPLAVLTVCPLTSIPSSAAQPEKRLPAEQVIPTSSVEFRSCKNW